MTVSIIIAVKTWQENLARCVKECQDLDFKDLEIIIFPDAPIAPDLYSATKVPVRVIPTGPVGPGHKRDLALSQARGDILAIIDDDAYPSRQWLAKAMVHFNDPLVAAVGGPAVTPREDCLRQQASGAVYSTWLVSGGFVYRYLPRAKRLVDDLPSCNFLVRRSVMEKLGGFNTRYWPGEDTKLCLDITHALTMRIVYDPEVLVYHHRRKLFIPHLVQVSQYALHRGYFVKKFPETSLKFAYFVPSAFVGYCACSVFIPFMPRVMAAVYLSVFVLYLTLVLLVSLARPRLSAMVFSGIIMTHIAYGIFFLKGLCAKKLKEDK